MSAAPSPLLSWFIYRVDDWRTQRQTLLGTVVAPSQPAALLAACREFNVTENDDQHKLRAVLEKVTL